MSNKVYESIFSVQSDIKNIQVDSENPHYRSRYASLEGLIDALKPLLIKHKLIVVQSVDKDGVNLVTRVTSVGLAEFEDFYLPFVNTKGDLHGLGGSMTYLRRQALKGIFGIAETDDDGNQAQGVAPQSQKAPMNHAPKTQGISEAQAKRLFAISKSKNWSDEDLKNVLKIKYGKTASIDLSRASYDEICGLIESGKTPKQIIG